MSGVRFQRGNHVVANLDRALTFYQGVLGFEVTYILPPKPRAILTRSSTYRDPPKCGFALSQRIRKNVSWL